MTSSHSPSVVVSFGDDVLERMELAVERVRERLKRATSALAQANLAYAVVGGNAVAAWVSRIDPAAVRNTVDVDLLVERAAFSHVRAALESVGFVYAQSLNVDMFLDGAEGKPREAVHLVYAGEKVRPEHLEPAPALTNSEQHETFRVVGLEALVQMKLVAFRRQDQVHLSDMIEVGLIDHSWPARLRPELAARLQELLDNPDG